MVYNNMFMTNVTIFKKYSRFAVVISKTTGIVGYILSQYLSSMLVEL